MESSQKIFIYKFGKKITRKWIGLLPKQKRVRFSSLVLFSQEQRYEFHCARFFYKHGFRRR